MRSSKQKNTLTAAQEEYQKIFNTMPRDHKKLEALLKSKSVSVDFRPYDINPMFDAIHRDRLMTDHYFDSKLVDLLLTYGFNPTKPHRHTECDAMAFFIRTVNCCAIGRLEWNKEIEANIWETVKVFQKHKIQLNAEQLKLLERDFGFFGDRFRHDPDSFNYKFVNAMRNDSAYKIEQAPLEEKDLELYQASEKLKVAKEISELAHALTEVPIISLNPAASKKAMEDEAKKADENLKVANQLLSSIIKTKFNKPQPQGTSEVSDPKGVRKMSLQ